MTRHNTLKVKWSNAELNKLKSGIKNGTEVTLNLEHVPKEIKFFVQLKIYNYFKNMIEEYITQEFRLKDIDETRNYFQKN